VLEVEGQEDQEERDLEHDAMVCVKEEADWLEGGEVVWCRRRQRTDERNLRRGSVRDSGCIGRDYKRNEQPEQSSYD
jgi:hypothetical protein